MKQETLDGGHGNSDGASPSSEAVSRRSFVNAAGGVAVAGLAVAAASWLLSEGSEGPAIAQAPRRIIAPRVGDSLPQDPTDAKWEQVTPVDIPLLPQSMTTPRVPTATIDKISVRCMHNASEIAFRLEWTDNNADGVEAIQRFRDSVAVQLPTATEEPTSVIMGQAGRPAHILHWRASWQAEIEKGPRTVTSAFPNAVSDLVPEKILGEQDSRVFYPAVYVDNPIARRDRKSPVEELIAEGFGTITSQAEQRAQGKGVLSNGRWLVVMSIPMAGGTNQANLSAGSSTQLAVAAWNGGAGNRGARKQWGNWVPLDLEA